ncbi:MAG: bacteriohemerythrin [Candidatus Polarisedimenticolia bacterium]
MPLITWTDELSVGVRQCDEEHKQLVAMINRLHAAMLEGKGKDVVGPVLRGLVLYVAVHFRNEERLLQTYGYPSLPAHQAEHRKLTAQVAAEQERFEKGQVALAVGLMDFLRDWLVKHIQGSDRLYGAYLNERGVH